MTSVRDAMSWLGDVVSCSDNRWWGFIVMALLITIVILEGAQMGYWNDPWRWPKGSFYDPGDSQYNKRYISADVAVANQQSLNDRLVANQQAAMRAHASKSSLTGTRDVPVFFQDYDADLELRNGNLYNSREAGESSAFYNKREQDCGIPGVCQ
jgi:hypothetical protein